MKKKILGGVAVMVIAAVGVFNVNFSNSSDNLLGITMANIEALANGESGAKCPNGCSSIGWGTSKILECDCNYDHFSSCSRWGC